MVQYAQSYMSENETVDWTSITVDFLQAYTGKIANAVAKVYNSEELGKAFAGTSILCEP